MTQRIAGAPNEAMREFLSRRTQPKPAPRKLSGLHRCDLAGPYTAPISSRRRRYHRCRICGRMTFTGTYRRKEPSSRAQA